MTTKQATRCKKHPRYQGRFKPRDDCKACWEIFDEYTESVRRSLHEIRQDA